MLQQEIFRLAMQMAPAGADPALLQTLCRAAEQSLASRLRPGMTPAACRDAFIPAAAWTAISQLPDAEADGVARFTVGEVTIEKTESARTLQQKAAQLLAPYCADGFAFRGVRG